uniref:Immunoevasive protein-2B n=2 Tax=Cotesia chilonis TaxID=89804 RepID=A0A411G5V6_9HYME|nr:immunoevasive protein-2B [Cotesia chilonis]
MYTYVLILQLVTVSSVLAVRGTVSTTRNLGYPCSETLPCDVENAACSPTSHQCECNKNYLADTGRCVQYAKKAGDFCASSFLVCKSVKNSYCSDNKCQCRWRYTEVGGKCRPTLNCKCVFNSSVEDERCYGDGVTCSKDNQCSCQPGYVQHMRKCEKQADLGEVCSSDFQCAWIPNSFCNSTCQCEPTYTMMVDKGQRKCVKSFDAPCEKNEDCGLANMKCLDGTCQCHEHYYENNNICNVKTTSLTKPCDHYKACWPQNSICNNNKCQCDWNYFKKDGNCVKGLHAPCNLKSECRKRHSYCINKKCACKPKFEEYSGACVRKT